MHCNNLRTFVKSRAPARNPRPTPYPSLLPHAPLTAPTEFARRAPLSEGAVFALCHALAALQAVLAALLSARSRARRAALAGGAAALVMALHRKLEHRERECEAASPGTGASLGQHACARLRRAARTGVRDGGARCAARQRQRRRRGRCSCVEAACWGECESEAAGPVPGASLGQHACVPLRLLHAQVHKMAGHAVHALARAQRAVPCAEKATAAVAHWADGAAWAVFCVEAAAAACWGRREWAANLAAYGGAWRCWATRSTSLPWAVFTWRSTEYKSADARLAGSGTVGWMDRVPQSDFFAAQCLVNRLLPASPVYMLGGGLGFGRHYEKSLVAAAAAARDGPSLREVRLSFGYEMGRSSEGGGAGRW
ncbi:hypothetical protein GGX14DRAFT_405810 [Mycena pura]|uniref:Uncharacterized protein n=1 Tax=Mycena pura TaxID=153505 RepID=A0AAD6UYH7_9AGAR|nr:hypothetical protein GGX14DRAFT_405810 [Mycena pura]